MDATSRNVEFQKYLQFHEIDSVRLSIVAQVRYSTVYNAKNGIPITPENAQRIEEAVLRLTGVAYTGSFPILTVSDGFPEKCWCAQTAADRIVSDEHWFWLWH